jgi:hypothetical protein
MPSAPSSSARYRRLLLLVALAVTLCALVAPVVVSADQTYTLSYVGTDYEAGAVQETAYFWDSLDEAQQTRLTTAQRAGTVTLADRPGYLDGGGETRFSVVRDERVYQYRFDHETDPWWLDYRLDVLFVGAVLTVGTAGFGAVRRVDALWE